MTALAMAPGRRLSRLVRTGGVAAALCSLALAFGGGTAQADVWYPCCGKSIDRGRTFYFISGGPAAGCLVGAGGATTGGAIGTVVPGVGNAAGVAGGAGIGFVSGFCTAAYYLDQNYDKPAAPAPPPPGVMVPPAQPAPAQP